jgi:hypothetical protein
MRKKKTDIKDTNTDITNINDTNIKDTNNKDTNNKDTNNMNDTNTVITNMNDTNITVGSRVVLRENVHLKVGKVIALDTSDRLWIQWNNEEEARRCPAEAVEPIPDTVTPTLLREDVEWLIGVITWLITWSITGAGRPKIKRIVAALEKTL